MSCPSCIRHIEDVLRALDGVGDVEVRLRDGKVRVHHDTGATANQLIAALGDAGYESTLGAAA